MFVSPFANLQLMLLDDRTKRPWILTEKLVYEYPPTGEIFEVPKNFMTDLVSIPKAIMALPMIGQALFMEFFGTGMWLGAKEGALHDWLCTKNAAGEYPVPAEKAHEILRYAMREYNYPESVIEAYHSALVAAYKPH